MALKIGLTGGIASGKSMVTRYLRELGVRVVDMDAISRQLTASGGLAIPLIRDQFGAEYIDGAGAMDRAKMRALVFKHGQARQQLEAILHPLIRAQALTQSEQVAFGYLVYDIPLLLESGHWLQLVDRVCVVDTEVSTQIERVRQRDQIDLDTIQSILDVQVTREERLEMADDVILNSKNTSLDDLHKQVQKKHVYWTGLVPDALR